MNTSRNLRRWFMVAGGLLLLPVLLVGCNSGGDSETASTPTSTPVVTTTPTTTNTTVILDASVPANVSARIEKLVTPSMSGPVGSALTMPALASGAESAILAIDAHRNIVLAAIATTATTSLSADSTALFMARVALGVLPAGVTTAQVTGDIRASTGYSDLVSKVSAALANGVLVAESSAVLSSLASVLSDATRAIRTQTTASSASGQAHVLKADRTVDLPLPFTVIGVQGAFSAVPGFPLPRDLGTVSILGASSTGGVNIRNKTPMEWMLSVRNTSGDLLSGPIRVPGQDFWSSIFGDPESVTASGNGVEFEVTLEQDEFSHHDNATDLVENLWLGAFTLIGFIWQDPKTPANCALALATAVVGPGLNDWARASTMDAFWAYLRGIFTNPANLIIDVTTGLSSCGAGKAAAASAEWVVTVGGFIVKIEASLLGAGLVVVSSGSWAYQASEMQVNWNEKRTVGVCEAGGQIVNCVYYLTLSPSPGTVRVGGDLQMTVAGKDSKEVATPVLSNLVWSLSPAAGIAVLDHNHVLTGVSEGVVFVEVTDPETGTKASSTIQVTSTTRRDAVNVFFRQNPGWVNFDHKDDFGDIGTISSLFFGYFINELNRPDGGLTVFSNDPSPTGVIPPPINWYVIDETGTNLILQYRVHGSADPSPVYVATLAIFKLSEDELLLQHGSLPPVRYCNSYRLQGSLCPSLK